jgi:2-dehydropantoate 2-reductase
MDRPTIAILGPGGVGGFLAAALTRAGTPVTVVAREATAELIAREGLRVSSVLLGDFDAHPQATATLDRPVDVLIVATKAGGLAAGLERIVAEPTLVVPQLNGLDHMSTLRARFGDRVVAGTIRIEVDRPEPARIVQTSPFLRVDIATPDGDRRPSAEALARALTDAGVPAQVHDSESQILWSKLVRLNAIACTTSAHDLPIGALRTDPALRAELEAVVRETVAVAVAEGAQIDADRVIAELDATHAALGSSMQRDIAAGRPPELDAIPGAVLRAADRHGLRCPTIELLVGQIAARAGVGLPRR